MTDQSPSIRPLSGPNGVDDGDLQGPITAPGGWSSLLTWRKPKSKAASQTPRLESIMRTPPPVRKSLPRYSPSGDHQRTSSRSRAPIPFDLGPRRTASSSSTISNKSYDNQSSSSSSSIILTDPGMRVEEQEEDEEGEFHTLSPAFATLARVREKDKGGVHATVRSTRIASSSSTRRLSLKLANTPSTPEDLPPGGWLAWGTSRLRSTIPRGVSSALFYSDDSKEPTSDDSSSHNVISSPTTTYSTPSAKASEKWISSEMDNIDRYVDRMVGFAGVDGESRSIVTLTAPNLPPWDQVSHDAILQRILTRTLPLVESPGGYTLILFASGADLIDGSQGSKTVWPGWAWCWKAWRSLGRSYRKNLKKLYIVHPTRFTRTLVRLISTGSYFISPKFAKKIIQCDTLKALNDHVPLQQLDIFPEVLIWDLKMGAKEDCDAIDAESGSAKVPGMVRDCVDALKGNVNSSKGDNRCLLEVEGIFRVSPSNALLRSAKYAYRLNQRPNFAPFVEKDPHLPAALLKDYLRSLPSPMFPTSVYPTIEICPTSSEEEMLLYIRETLLPLLEEDKIILLSYVLQCLHEVSLRCEKNRMDASNLAVVITPNLVRGDDVMKDVSMCRLQKMEQSKESQQQGIKTTTTTTLATIVMFCIDRYFEVFDEVDYELPTLNFHTGEEILPSPSVTSVGGASNDLGTLTNSKRAAIGGIMASRQLPSSSPTNLQSPLLATLTPSSPSTNTPTTLRSTNSLRIKNRLLSGGSFRKSGGSLNSFEKGNQSVALVGTSVMGEFEKGGGSSSNAPNVVATPRKTSSSIEWDQEDARSGNGSEFSLPTSPTLQTRRATNDLEASGSRHERRALSGVFEE